MGAVRIKSGVLKVHKNHNVAYETFAVRSFVSSSYKCECGWASQGREQGRAYKWIAAKHISAESEK